METSALCDLKLDTFVSVLKAIIKYAEEHDEKNIPITKIKTLLDHYKL